MSWHRGLLFAVIHLLLAAVLVLVVEVRYHPHPKFSGSFQPSVVSSKPQLLKVDGEEVEFSANPCMVWHSLTPEERILDSAYPFAAVFSGFDQDCPGKYSVATVLGVHFYTLSLAQRVQIDAAFLFFVLLQWYLMGAFPLFKIKHWYLELGTIMTMLAAISILLVAIPFTRDLSRIPASFLLLAFLIWLITLLGKVFFQILLCFWRGGNRLVATMQRAK